LLCIAVLQVAGRSLGELVRKLGERVLPSIIPILSQGLKDPSASRRQVSYLNKTCLVDNFFFSEKGLFPNSINMNGNISTQQIRELSRRQTSKQDARRSKPAPKQQQSDSYFATIRKRQNQNLTE
jgi:hypothetical protein